MLFVLSCSAFTVVLYELDSFIVHSRASKSDYLDGTRIFAALAWTLFPIIWLLAYCDLISMQMETNMYTFGDICVKTFVNFAMELRYDLRAKHMSLQVLHASHLEEYDCCHRNRSIIIFNL